MAKKKKKMKSRFFKRVFSFLKRRVWGGYMTGGIVGLYHYFRCKIWNRYHIINISNMTDDYSWGWLDRDHVLLLVSFKILKDFVEQEDPMVGLRTAKDYSVGGGADEGLKLQLEREQEIRALYTWWTDERPAAWEAMNKDLESGKLFRSYWEREEALSEKDDEMLIRLVKVRGSLWT